MNIINTLKSKDPVRTHRGFNRKPFPLYMSLLALGLLSASSTTLALTGISFQKLVSYGQQRPDFNDPDSADYFYDVACAAIDGGDVIFRALSDVPRAGYDSIWTIKATGTGLRKVIGKARKVPGGVGNFIAFGSSNGGDYTNSPLLRNGRAVFFGYDENPDTNLQLIGGLYSINLADKTLRRVANYKTPNPGDKLTHFTQFGGESAQPCHNGFVFNGATVFFHALSPDHDGVYQAAYDGSKLQKIRDAQDIDYPDVPDVGDVKLPITNYYGPALGFNPDNGNTLFGYIGASVVGARKIYVGDTPRFKHTVSLPGDPSAENSSFNHLQLDGRNAVFYATGGTDYFGIFSKASKTAQVHKIVSNLNKLPGMSQCPIDNLSSFVADAGRVFFWAHTSNCDGQTANGRSGIFMAQNNKIVHIVRTGDSLGDGSSAVEVFNEIGPGSVQGNRLAFTLRTTASLRVLYVATLLP